MLSPESSELDTVFEHPERRQKMAYSVCVRTRVCVCTCVHVCVRACTGLEITVGHRSFSMQKFIGAEIPVNSRPSRPSKWLIVNTRFEHRSCMYRVSMV